LVNAFKIYLEVVNFVVTQFWIYDFGFWIDSTKQV